MLMLQLLALKGRDSSSGSRPINLNKETHEGSWSNGSDENSCDHVNNTSIYARYISLLVNTFNQCKLREKKNRIH